MQVLVLGAGVTGIMTAWFLARDGAEVTVVDRRPGPAQETSFANGGHLSASQSRPWAMPEAPIQLLRWIGRRDAPFRLPLHWNPPLWRWGLSYLANCRKSRVRTNAQTLQQLARFSQTALLALAEEQGLQFSLRTSGLLAVFRDTRALVRAARRAEELGGATGPEQALDAEACANLEPALGDAAAAGHIAGGIFSSDGGTGDAHAFTATLAESCAATGVRFRYGLDVLRLKSQRGRVSGVETSDGDIAAEAVVLALGPSSRTVAASAGVRLPLVPVKGYSISFPAPADDRLPSLGILDEKFRVVTSRLGSRFRTAGIAEFGATNTRVDDRRAETLLTALHDLYPAAPLPDVAAASPWAGLRTMTPDGPPLLGPVPRVLGLYLNTGHGPLGWTLAAGTARMVADSVGGRKPAIDYTGLTLARFA